MLIISGADLVGKSTFVKKCCDVLSTAYSQKSCIVTHLTRPPKNFDYFRGYVERMSVDSVWDRFTLDNLAYRANDDHQCSMTPDKWNLLQAHLALNCVFQVVLYAENDFIEANHKKRGDNTYSLDHILKVNATFRSMCGVRQIKVREHTYDYKIDMYGTVFDKTVDQVCSAYMLQLNRFRNTQ